MGPRECERLWGCGKFQVLRKGAGGVGGFPASAPEDGAQEEGRLQKKEVNEFFRCCSPNFFFPTEKLPGRAKAPSKRKEGAIDVVRRLPLPEPSL